MEKKRKKHRASIMQNKADKTCYLCERLHENYQPHRYLEEHHVFMGPNRHLSEEYGLKVYLCMDHHRNGRESAHRNAESSRLLQRDGQEAFERAYPDENFIEIFGRNYG